MVFYFNEMKISRRAKMAALIICFNGSPILKIGLIVSSKVMVEL